MPSPASAVVQNYDFGAAPSASTPAAANEVLRFAVHRGGRVDLTFLNTEIVSAANLHVTVQVSADAVTWTTTTAAGTTVIGENETAVSNITIKPGCKYLATVLLNAFAKATATGATTSSGASAGSGGFVRVLATGTTALGVRGILQIRDADDKLQILRI